MPKRPLLWLALLFLGSSGLVLILLPTPPSAEKQVFDLIELGMPLHKAEAIIDEAEATIAGGFVCSYFGPWPTRISWHNDEVRIVITLDAQQGKVSRKAFTEIQPRFPETIRRWLRQVW